MVIRFIRAIIQSITGTTNRFFLAEGRPDETVKGKMYQHYGFRSMPPQGCELFTIQSDNNSVSVAENDGDVGKTVYGTLAEGDVAIYTINGGILKILNGGNFNIVTKKSGSYYSFNFNGDAIESASPIAIKNPNSISAYYIVTEKFLTSFCNHVHPDPASGVTGSPVYPAAPLVPITPIMLAGDLTETLKGD